MINLIIYNLLSYAYLLCTVLYGVHCAFQAPRVGRAATLAARISLAAHACAFALRWAESYRIGIGHLPIRGPYECLTFSAGTVLLFYLVIEVRIRTRALGAVIMPIIALMMICASLNSHIDSQILPMPEVLQGNYINYHLVSCFVGYGAFTVSFVASLLFLLTRTGIITETNLFKRIYIEEVVLDDVSYRMIAVGFIMFSILIVTGMFRSRIIWGHYWQWDPVQTWSLLAWIVYAVILHGRYLRYWSGRATAMLSIAGFVLAMISFAIGAGFALQSGHFPITQ